MSSACAISEYIFSSVFIGSSPCRGLFPVALSGVALPALSALPQAFAPFLAVGVLDPVLPAGAGAPAPARPGVVPRLLRGLAPVAIGGRGFWRRSCLIAAVPGRRVPRVRPGSPGEGSGFPSLTSPPSSPSPWPRGQGDLSAPVLSLGPLGFCGLHAHGFRLVARPDCTVPPMLRGGFLSAGALCLSFGREGLCLLALGLSCFLSPARKSGGL